MAIVDAERVTRTAAFRIIGIVGFGLCTIATTYFVGAILAGATDPTRPAFYLAVFTAIGGALINLILINHARVVRTRTSVALASLSLLMSGALMLVLAYVFLDLGSR